MASQQRSETQESSEFIVCEFCEDVQRANNHCDDCLANFCDCCAESHRKLSTKGCHRVEPGVCRYDLQLELCPVDDQKLSFYCRTCLVRVCPECEINRKSHVMHDVVSLTRLVGQEKEKLLDKLDDVTTKTETISYLPDDVKSMCNQIELKWLERKEMIRQEFASLFETLTTQQGKLLADMEEEVKQSLERLGQLQQDHSALLSTTCQLSDECISAVQNLPRDQFLSSYPQFLESVKDLEHKVDRMESPKDHIPSFLQVPFSLYKEKLHLHNSLQLSAFNVQAVKAREHHRFVPYDRLKEEVTINTLLETPTTGDLPPSTMLRYGVNIYCGSRQSKKKPVWSNKKPLRAGDTVINGSCGHRLLPGNLYMVKIRPIITCFTHTGDQSVEGRVVSIVIVTDTPVGSGFLTEPVLAAGDSQLAISDRSSLFNSMFEHGPEDSLSCTNVAGAGAKNHNNNSSSSSSNRGTSRSRGQNRNKPNRSPTNKPLWDPFLGTSFLCNGAGALSGGLHCSFPARACYKFAVPSGKTDTAYPVHICDGTLISQRRYVADCCFEEARLMEDSGLKVSRLILFDN